MCHIYFVEEKWFVRASCPFLAYSEEGGNSVDV